MTMIGILTSEAGCGKSFQAMQWEEDIKILDLENRLEEKKNRFFKDKLIEIVPLMKYDKDYMVDEVGSFNGFVLEVHNILKSEPPRTLIIDGIGELRDFAHSKWAQDKGRKKAANPGDWEAVNDLVRETLFPIINFARIKNFNVLFTSQLKDDYTVIEQDGKRVSSKCGRIPAHKEWIGYNVDLLVDLSINKKMGTYQAEIIKSPVGIFTEDITGKSLFEVLSSRGL